MTMTRDEVRPWRREQRARLIAYRSGLPREQRDVVRDRVVSLLRETVPGPAEAIIGFYWPFKGEVDLRSLMRELLAGGAKAALPAVIEKAQPVEFRAWYPGVRMERGIWDIPVPAPGNPVRPTVLFVPLVGFDAAGYRLGHGGGYYDRTLATLTPKPLCIGVGYAATRLDTIHPQPHDIPMDAIATEAGLTWFEGSKSNLRRTEGSEPSPAAGGEGRVGAERSEGRASITARASDRASRGPHPVPPPASPGEGVRGKSSDAPRISSFGRICLHGARGRSQLGAFLLAPGIPPCRTTPPPPPAPPPRA